MGDCGVVVDRGAGRVGRAAVHVMTSCALSGADVCCRRVWQFRLHRRVERALVP